MGSILNQKTQFMYQYGVTASLQPSMFYIQ